MIDSISSSISSYSSSTSSSSRSNSNVLSFDQQQTLQDVLSNYDPDNLSTSDAQEIVSAFQEAGISPSKSLADAMDSLGFDAQEVGSLAGVGGPQGAGGMPPPPPPPKEDENSISDILSELLDNDDEDDTSNTYTNAYSSGSNSSSFESVLDYTSRILSLNDEAKQEVMDLFETYKPENTELSSKDVSNLIKNSLQDILGDSENYNSTSFYA